MIGNLCSHGPKSKEINTRIPNDPSPSLHSKNQEFSLPKQPKRCIFCHPPSDWYQKPHLHNHHQLNHSRVVIEDLIRHFSLLPQNDETNQTNETKQLYITLKVNSGYHHHHHPWSRGRGGGPTCSSTHQRLDKPLDPTDSVFPFRADKDYPTQSKKIQSKS